VLDTTGAVRALVGGESYRASRLDRATNARRQPGSAFKPFLYLAALEKGWAPESPIEDRPIVVGDWRPENIDGRYRGRVSLADAFALSLNTAAVRLVQNVGPEAVVATARRLGIAAPLPAVPSLALGTAEVSLLELTSAYLPFATGGIRPTVHAVREVKDDRGRILYRFASSSRRVIDPSTATTMQQLLRAVVERGTGRAARLPDRVVTGKTGTSQGFRDAWFVGAAGELVVGVWVGNDDGRPMRGVTGGSLPAQIAREVLRAVPPTAPRGPALARVAPTPSEPPVPSQENGLALILDWVSRTFGGR